VTVVSDSVDVAGPARTVIQYLLTVGTAAVYGVLVLMVVADVWVGSDAVTVDKIQGGVMNSIAITFGSAFVGWFGISANRADVTIDSTSKHRKFAVLAQLFTDLAGAAVFAMLVYLAIGAVAGVTYLFNQADTPTVLITVATAWAAQASAVVAATLSAVLKPPENRGAARRPRREREWEPDAG
jgi:hypothetical protein